MSNDRPERKEVSLGELASEGIKKISGLAKSSLMSEKLQGMSALLFAGIIAISFTRWLVSPSDLFQLTGAVMLVLGLLVGFALSLGYIKILDTVVGFSKDPVKSLRIGVTILFFVLPISVTGLIVNSVILINLALGAIVLQLLIVAISFFIESTESIHDVPVKPSNFRQYLGDIGSICSIIGLVLTIVLPIIITSGNIIHYQCIDGTIQTHSDKCPNIDEFIENKIASRILIQNTTVNYLENATVTS